MNDNERDFRFASGIEARSGDGRSSAAHPLGAPSKCAQQEPTYSRKYANDPGHLLEEAILRQFKQFGASGVNREDRPWASITFSGSRHIFRFNLSARHRLDDAASVAAKIGEDQFQLGHHLLADIVAKIDRSDTVDQLIVEALTVEAA
jgi:hypothetical protein